MCLYPTLRKNPKYKSTKKNGGNIPQMPDKRVQYVPTGCGNCKECRKQKSRDWQVRLMEDIKTNTNGKFITLTFSDESITKLTHEINKNAKWDIKGYELDNAIAILAMRRFNERYRKKYKKAIRHWTVTELGHNGTENIHLHGIIWTNETYDTIEKLWKYGHIWPNKEQQSKTFVNAKTVNYVVKYVSKMDEQHKYYKPLTLTSPGIGKNYTETFNYSKNSYNAQKTKETYKTETGHEIMLPIYYRNKRYTDEQREQLWIQKLDKEIMYVCGEKIDISKNFDEYNKTLAFHRERNRQLGYGNDEKDWEREQYELNRRIIQQETRIQKGMKKSNKCARRAGSNQKGPD